jgi:hypothetical protein
MRTRVVLLMGLVLLFPEVMRAQETRTFTQMILGVGVPGWQSVDLVPAYTVGFEVRRANSGIRVAAEYWENETMGAASYQSSRTAGVQILGVRSFGARRVQPYLLAGAGLYTSDMRGSGQQFTLTDSGLVAGPYVRYERRELLPAIIWGVGTSIRVRSTTLFGEVKLPLYHDNAFRAGPQSPLVIGIRF